MRGIDSGVSRSRSLNLRQRPASVNIGAGATHIKDREIKGLDYEATFTSAEPDLPPLTHSESATNISSDIEYLKAKEEEERERKQHHKRLSSGSKHMKRSSLPSIGLAAGTKLLAGKFGDAFKRFEGSDSNNGNHRDRSESPSRDPINVLTPIAGSEATDLSDDRPGWDETEELSPEMKRELEKRKLEAEERRVANAAAEYRQRLAARGGGSAGAGVSTKASSIQNRVQSLLSENDRPSQKTASGYGRFTESPEPQQRVGERSQTFQPPRNVPVQPLSTSSAPASAVDLARGEIRSQRPVAPPKPKVLQNAIIDNGATRDETEVKLDDDWEVNFSKRYPSLSGLEMVETSIEDPKKMATVRTKEI